MVYSTSTSRRRSRALRLAGTLMITLAAACGDGVFDPDRPVASVAVAPEAHTLVAGETHTLSATARDASGAALAGRSIVWQTSDTQIATVSAQGVVTAVASGTATVTATSEGKRGAALITVNNPAPMLQALAPSSAQAGGEAFVLTVTGTGFVPTTRVLWNGEPLQTTRVSATELRAQVGAPALADQGSVQVTVENPLPGGGTSSPIAFEISRMPVASITFATPALSLDLGDEATLAVTLHGADGRTLTGRVVTWMSNDPRIAEVDANGKVTALREGTTSILAVSEGRSASASVAVELRPAADLVFNRIGELFTLDLRTQGTQPVRVNTGTVSSKWTSRPSPSPDGGRIAFAGDTEPATAQTFTNIYVVDRGGANLRRLTNLPGIADDPAWSPVPGANRIAFRHHSSETHRSDIWVMDADGTNPRNLTGHLPEAGRFSPAWSPDGQWIAFAQSGAGYVGSIWIIRADGSGAREVTSQLNGQDANPTWSPDGEWIAFTRFYHNGTDITVVGVNGGGAVRIPLPDNQVGAAWSPDGQFIAFAQYRAGSGHMTVYTMRPNGTDVRVRASGFFPAWIRRP